MISLRPRLPRLLALTGLVAVSVLAVACGDDSAAGPPEGLDPAATRGYELARDSGCFACHGPNGNGDGPANGWVALAGSQVELKDGTTVTADPAYLLQSILAPGALVAAGSAIAMPPNTLTEEQAGDIVAYIESLG